MAFALLGEELLAEHALERPEAEPQLDRMGARRGSTDEQKRSESAEAHVHTG
jgi:hypothetical protein